MTRIGIVDDDPALLEGLTIILRDEGYEVTTFTDAATALLHSQAQPPALWLIDLTLGGAMSGEKLIASLRQQQATANVPVIIMSGVADLQSRAHQLGVAFLPKPSPIDDILTMIERFVIMR